MHLGGIALIIADYGNLHEDYHIALLPTPLSVIMGHAFPSRSPSGQESSLISDDHDYSQCFQTRVGLHLCSMTMFTKWKGESMTQ